MNTQTPVNTWTPDADKCTKIPRSPRCLSLETRRWETKRWERGWYSQSTFIIDAGVALRFPLRHENFFHKPEARKGTLLAYSQPYPYVANCITTMHTPSSAVTQHHLASTYITSFSLVQFNRLRLGTNVVAHVWTRSYKGHQMREGDNSEWICASLEEFTHTSTLFFFSKHFSWQNTATGALANLFFCSLHSACLPLPPSNLPESSCGVH